MTMPEPLVIRRSLTNWNFILQTAFALGSVGYGYGLFARWPDIATRHEAADYALGGFFIFCGASLFVFLTLRSLLDRTPLLQMDEAGIRSIEIGNLPVPWHEVGNCYFEQISEGRNYYWYFFFTQTDAATGLKFNFKILADEFDQDNDEVLALIEAFKAADKSRPQAKPRPNAIETDLAGDHLVLGYSLAKELRAIGLYWLIALSAVALPNYISAASDDGLFSLWQFVLTPWEVLQRANRWVFYFSIAAFAIATFASLFRLRDMFLRSIALRVDRDGLKAADLGGETVPWQQIAGLSFEPYSILKVTNMSGGHPVDRFVSIGLHTSNPQEIYEALCWLLVHFKVKFSRPWEVAPPQEQG